MKALRRRRQGDTARNAKRLRETTAAQTHSNGSSDTPPPTRSSLGDHIDTRRIALPVDDGASSGDDSDGNRMLKEAWERRGRLQRNIATTIAHATADESLMARIGHNRVAITSVAAMDGVLVYGDKSGTVFRVTCNRDSNAAMDRTTLAPSHDGAVLCVALSDTRSGDANAEEGFNRSTVDRSIRSYIISGGMDGLIRVWTHIDGGIRHMGDMKGHRGPVTGAAFRLLSATLLTVSTDTTVRIWSVPELTRSDTLYGHTSAISCIAAARGDRAVTGASDGSFRSWRCAAGTTVVLAPSDTPVDAVTLVTEQYAVCATQGGSLALYHVSQRHPLFVIEAAHGKGFLGDGTGLERAALMTDQRVLHTPNAIISVASLFGTDCIASGAVDGSMIVWRVAVPGEGQGRDVASLTALRQWQLNGMVSSLSLVESADGVFAVAACAKEPRLGRWASCRSFNNEVVVVPLTGCDGHKLLGSVGDCPSLYIAPTTALETASKARAAFAGEPRLSVGDDDEGDSLFQRMPDGSLVPIDTSSPPEPQDAQDGTMEAPRRACVKQRRRMLVRHRRKAK